MIEPRSGYRAGLGVAGAGAGKFSPKGLTNAAEVSVIMSAEPPSRRAAEPPSRRAAEPPSRRAAEPPSRRAADECVRRMAALASPFDLAA